MDGFSYLQYDTTKQYSERKISQFVDIHQSVHRDTVMKGTNKMQLYRLEFVDIHQSVHRDTVMKGTNKMQLYRLIYYS